jgi:phosphoglycerate kinase
VSHRAHASIVGIPKYLPSYAGPLLDKEITELSSVFNPKHPFLFILGGAKFDTKLPLIEKFLGIADYLFIGGALANDIYKVRGLETGASLLSDSSIDLRPISSNKKVIVPSDVVVQGKVQKDVNEVLVTDKILDAGSATIAEMVDVLHEVKYVLWNGPLGDYENGYSEGTEMLARAIAESGVRSIVGGGDTVAVIRNANLLDKFSFVSTGGGAMLDFLAKGTLVGVEALKSR